MPVANQQSDREERSPSYAIGWHLPGCWVDHSFWYVQWNAARDILSTSRRCPALRRPMKDGVLRDRRMLEALGFVSG